MARFLVLGVMGLVELNGLVHHVLRQRLRAAWIPFATTLVDVGLMTVAMFGWTGFGSPDLPQQMALRDGLSVYFYILIVITGFSYNPALVLLAGLCSGAGGVGGGRVRAGRSASLVQGDGSARGRGK